MGGEEWRLPAFAGSVAAALWWGGGPPANAEDPRPEARGPDVVVRGEAAGAYAAESLSLTKLTEPVIDTPQMLTVAPRALIEDRGATSLSEVFRTSSGISLGAGESSWQGTNLSIRGFNARNDLYLDGMRDFGSYTRDPFDLEAVELLEGPSSILFGRGSTGGAVNQVSKTPTLRPHLEVEATGGTDGLGRGTLDVDAPAPALGSGAAVRLDALVHSQGVTDRDEVNYARFALAPSLALGLGSATRLVLAYLHQSEDDRPDYGLPYLRGEPAPVRRANYYGFTDDFLRTDADVGTARLEHDLGAGWSVRDQLRYAAWDRRWRDMEPQVVTAGVAPGTPLSLLQVNRALQGGRSNETFLQNQMDLTGRFRTGSLEHALVAGWEIGPETSKPTYDGGLGIPRASLTAPVETLRFTGTEYPVVKVATSALTTAAYVMDTVSLGSRWALTGGVRFDQFNSRYVAQFFSSTPATLGQPTRRQDVRQDDGRPSWRAAVVYKPTPQGSLYFDYATSFNPSAEALSQIVAVRSLNTGNIGLAPEENETFEVGTKWDLLARRLQLQAAIFREEKTNAREPDPTNSAFNILAGTQRVDGAELELAGQITAAWRGSVSYTHLDAKTVRSVPGGPPVGSPIFNAPADSAALWTTLALGHGVELGGGAQYLARRYSSLTTSPFTYVPAYATLELLLKWQLTEHVRAQVNVKNLTDRSYYDQVHGFHVIPGEGRTALFTLAWAG